MKLEEAIRILIWSQSQMRLGNLPDYSQNVYQSIETILQELEHLQKENEGYISGELMTRNQAKHFEEINKKYYIHKDKIKELILKKKQKIQDNNKEIEECRKTIMEEQELKKLKLYTLHKNNELLELEIADLFDLLKEE